MRFDTVETMLGMLWPFQGSRWKKVKWGDTDGTMWVLLIYWLLWEMLAEEKQANRLGPCSLLDIILFRNVSLRQLVSERRLSKKQKIKMWSMLKQVVFHCWWFRRMSKDSTMAAKSINWSSTNVLWGWLSSWRSQIWASPVLVFAGLK